MSTELLSRGNTELHSSSLLSSNDVSLVKPTDTLRVETPASRDGFESAAPAGRLTSPGWAGGVISEVNAQCGSAVRLGLAQGLKELGLEQLGRLVEKGGGKIKLPLGTSLGLRISEKTYKSGDRYITQDEVRKASDVAFRKHDKEILWVETAGISELGAGGAGTLPIGSLATGDGKLDLSGIVRYRRLEPYETPCGTIENGVSLNNAIQIPVNSELAKKMPPGSEFEIAGEGHATLAPELSSTINLYEGGPLAVALDSHAGLQHDAKGEISILVQKLLTPNQVMVKISQTGGSSTSLNAELLTQATVDTQSLNMIPKIGQGIMKYVLEKLGLSGLSELVQSLKTSVKAESMSKIWNREIKRYVFDLGNPEGRKAYDEIFARLSMKSADELAIKANSGVKSQGGSETETVSGMLAHAKMGETKMLLYQTLQNEREGRIHAELGQDLIFRESKFSEEYSSWFSGTKNINWESVAVNDGVNEEAKNYYHLTFKNSDRIAESCEIDDFLCFSTALGIDTGHKELKNSVDMTTLANVFVDRDDALTSIDIYFTDAGIRKMDGANFDQALASHLAVQTHFGSNRKKLPFLKTEGDAQTFVVDKESRTYEIAKRYAELQNKWFFMRWWSFGEMARLEEEYHTLCGGDVVSDASTVAESIAFANKMEALHTQGDQKSVKNFFSFMGRTTGFNCMKTIAAMALIAGADETLIHDLSMSAGGISLRSVDEGEIVHPEKEITRALASLA